MSAPRLDVPEGAPTECPGTQSEAAGKSSACDGCPNQAVCASGEAAKPDPVTSLVQARLSSVKHTILVLSGKGGVGKSTVSSQLAFTLASKGFQVGLLDVDICGPSIPRMLGLEGREVHQSAAGWSPVWLEDNLGVMSIGFMLPDKDDAIIWRGPKKNGLIKQFLTDVDWGDLDFLIVDTPPGTSDEHISIVQYLKGSVIAGAVVVTTPQEVAMMDVRKEINFCQKTGVPVLGVVENMSGFVCPGCKELHHIFPQSGAGPAGMAARYGVAFLGKIPLDPVMLTSCEKGEPYVTSHPDAPGVKPLLSVVHAILAAVGEPETAPAAAHAMDTRE